jgi:hypothetical protein
MSESSSIVIKKKMPEHIWIRDANEKRDWRIYDVFEHTT